jgi:hypothetical protein
VRLDPHDRGDEVLARDRVHWAPGVGLDECGTAPDRRSGFVGRGFGAVGVVLRWDRLVHDDLDDQLELFGFRRLSPNELAEDEALDDLLVRTL